MSSSTYIILYITVLIVVLRSGSAKHRKSIIVNKCCDNNERLNSNEECITENDSNWWPVIFMVLKQSYFEPVGSAPQFMKHRQQRPLCANAELFMGSHKFALFSNGTLYLSEKHKFIEPHNYCIDKNVAVICDHDVNSSMAKIQVRKSAKIRKCCVKNAKYNASQNQCVPETNSNTLLTTVYNNQTAFSNLTDFDVLFGFPDCALNKYITIAETFMDRNLNRETNRLELQSGRTLEWYNFCVENVILENETTEMSVITCTEHISIAHGTIGTVDTVTITFT